MSIELRKLTVEGKINGIKRYNSKRIKKNH